MSNDIFNCDSTKKKPKASLSKKTIALSAIGSVVAITLLGGAIFFGLNQANKSTGANDAEYQEVKKQYEEREIKYSYKDYLNDKSVIERNLKEDKGNEKDSDSKSGMESTNLDGLSDAYNKMNDANTEILNQVGSPLGIKDYTVDNVSNTILSQIRKTADFINTSYGWPSDKYPDDYFKEWRAYVNGIEKYAMGGKKPGENYYNEFSFDIQAKTLRKSAYEASQFTMVEYQDGDYPNLIKWYLTGRKAFTKIYNITLENSDVALSKEASSNLQASISTDNGNFKVYLIASVTNDSYGYRVLDFEAI